MAILSFIQGGGGTVQHCLLSHTLFLQTICSGVVDNLFLALLQLYACTGFFNKGLDSCGERFIHRCLASN